jgi:hypothetical protein
MEILEVTLGIRREPSDRVSRHVRSCESCQARVDGIRRMLGDVAAFGHEASMGAGDHLDEAALAEIAEGRGSPELSQSRVDHLTGCPSCRRGLASLLELLADEHVSREMQRLDTPQRATIPRSRRLAWVGGVLASGVAIATAVLMLLPGEQNLMVAMRHGSRTITASDTLELTYPIGDVADATRFRWRPVRGSVEYRLTLYDANSRVVYERELADTLVELPDSVRLAPLRSYLWKVEARTHQNRTVSSRLEEFSVKSGRAP